MIPGGRRVTDRKTMPTGGRIIDRLLEWADWMHSGAPLRRWTDEEQRAERPVVMDVVGAQEQQP